MKRLLFSLAMISAIMVGCDDSNDDGSNNNNIKVNEIKTVAVSGQWRITKFVDSGSDETNSFSGYIFEFESDNSVSATNGSNNYAGTCVSSPKVRPFES